MGVMGVGWPAGVVLPDQAGISDDRFIPGLRRMADAVHSHGAKIAAQLHFGGLVAAYAAAQGHEFWAPSMPHPQDMEYLQYFLPEEMAGGDRQMAGVKVLDKADIAAAVALYAEGARRAKEAGFDGVEIHGGHGYLISSFLSPSSNHRDDDYGGSLENRARLMLDVLRAVRATVGPDYPVWMKLDSRELGKEIGTTLEDAKIVARWLEENGADAITVTAYHDTAKPKLHSASNIPHEPDANIPAARAIKADVNIPVIASGRVEPEHGERFVAEGAFDFLAMGRKMLADPFLPNKLAQGPLRKFGPASIATPAFRLNISASRCAVRSIPRPASNIDVTGRGLRRASGSS